MSETIIHTDHNPEQGEKFSIFYVMIKFKTWQEGTMQVAAADRKHAEELVLEVLKDKESVEIFQILHESEIERFVAEESAKQGTLTAGTDTIQ